jgi:hypothetical protein
MYLARCFRPRRKDNVRASDPKREIRTMLGLLRRLMKKLRNGDRVYIKGLNEAYLGRHAKGMRLLEEAGERYRKEESVERLARLRVHQLMVKYQIQRSPIEKQKIVEEVVLRLSKLREIESPEPPFAPLDAREVLRNWMDEKAFVIGAGAVETVAGIEEEAILAELESALPCELIAALEGTEEESRETTT